MKDYFAPASWYEPDDYEPEYQCKDCLEKEQRLDDAQEYLEEVVKQLYMSDPLNEALLEHCLDELCHLLNVKMNTSDLKIQRSKKEEPKMFTDWKAFSQNFLAKQA